MIRQEERERTTAEAIAVINSVIEQHKNESRPATVSFSAALRLVYESPGEAADMFCSPRSLAQQSSRCGSRRCR